MRNTAPNPVRRRRIAEVEQAATKPAAWDAFGTPLKKCPRHGKPGCLGEFRAKGNKRACSPECSRILRKEYKLSLRPAANLKRRALPKPCMVAGCNQKVSGRNFACPKHREELKLARVQRSGRRYKIKHRDELNAKRKAKRHAARAAASPTIKQCIVCSKKFALPMTGGASKVCSEDCREKYKKARKLADREHANALQRVRRHAKKQLAA